MAMTLRLTNEQEEILDRLCERFEISTKSKMISWLIENFSKIESERDTLKWDNHELRGEIGQIKTACREYKEHWKAMQKIYEIF